jgi:S-adenosylmethionine-diacylglycerol 3-amino-3-carboxypropyl transferase
LGISKAVHEADLLHAVPDRVFSNERMLDNLFSRLFNGLVYPQIWEDPEVDMEALAIAPTNHIVAIASGGCNILSYLIADPARVTAVDLSKAHIALNNLKLTAARQLPTAEYFYRFFGSANEPENLDAYWQFIAPRLDAESRAYWEAQTLFGMGRQRISLFSRNLYRYGVLGRCIGLAHLLSRLYGINAGDVLHVGSIAEQRAYFDTVLAPLFEKRFVRWLARWKLSLYGLGIPQSQYAALAGEDDMARVLRGRLEKLVCGFRVQDNYFAWQAFGRRYPEEACALPPYLQHEYFGAVRERAHRVTAVRRSLTAQLEHSADASVDRYVLLDAQDWMSDEQLNALWRQITRTARPAARVIFRTAAEPSLLPGRLADELLSRWRYEDALSRELGARDRSAVYGGFHLYVLRG